MKKLLFLLFVVVISFGLSAEDLKKEPKEKKPVEWVSLNIGAGVFKPSGSIPVPSFLFQLGLMTLRLDNFYIGPYVECFQIFSISSGISAGLRFPVSENQKNYISFGAEIGGGRDLGWSMTNGFLSTGLNLEYRRFFRNGVNNGIGMEGSVVFCKNKGGSFGPWGPGLYVYYIIGY
ncbi:MAG TPA: hypothetical protein P5044_00850 [bacterium]|nr:hypothetical protein [bacterium]